MPWGWQYYAWCLLDTTRLERAIRYSISHAQMLSALRESQAQMEAVLHSMADGLVAASPLGLVSMMNPAAEQMYGYSAQEALGAPVTSGRLFYCTAPGGFTDHEIPITEANRRAGLEALEIVDRHGTDQARPGNASLAHRYQVGRDVVLLHAKEPVDE